MSWFFLALPLVLAVAAAGWLRTRRYRLPDDVVHRTLSPWLLPVFVALGAVLGAPFFDGRGALVIITYAVALVWATVLAFIDLDVRRLPDFLTLPAYPVVAAALAGASALGHDWTSLLRAAAAGIAVAVFSVAARLGRTSGGPGYGDAKLAGVLAALLAWFGWINFVMGLLSGFVVGGVVALVLLVAVRTDRHAHISLGPAMICGAYLWCLMVV